MHLDLLQDKTDLWILSTQKAYFHPQGLMTIVDKPAVKVPRGILTELDTRYPRTARVLKALTARETQYGVGNTAAENFRIATGHAYPKTPQDAVKASQDAMAQVAREVVQRQQEEEEAGVGKRAKA